MKLFMMVGMGGFLGSSLRYLIQKYTLIAVQTTFPYVTLAINLIGCFLIGLVFGLCNTKQGLISTEMQFFLVSGFCGGFTTFSAFSHESLLLLKDGNYNFFFLYIILSVFIGIGSTFFGYLCIK